MSDICFSCLSAPCRCNRLAQGWPIVQSAKGWECPKCGGVYSPTTPQCFHCKPKDHMRGTTG